MNNVTLGILGGLGPMSGVYFCELLVAHTKAESDGDHINFLLSSRADTPDRTEYILGHSSRNPVPVMIEEVQKLTAAGADLIAIPCNTAHYFYESIVQASSAPVLNIIHETVELCRARGMKRVGVLATEGTIRSGSYEQECRRAGVGYMTCTEDEQKVISQIIYEQIKRGRQPDLEAFRRISASMRERGCEAMILGCTELSLLKKMTDPDPMWIDSLEVLAVSAIRACGKEPIGFDQDLMKFMPTKGKNPCC